jgi:hypothetical protein
MSHLPDAWLGSTIMGRWLSVLIAGTALISKVFLVYVSNVRMPLSHRITFAFPSAIIYSADISSSSTVADIPLFNNTGLSDFPALFKRGKFCIFLAPIWSISA